MVDYLIAYSYVAHTGIVYKHESTLYGVAVLCFKASHWLGYGRA
jgi:hypothetical protein